MKRLSLLRHIVLSVTLFTSCINSGQNGENSSTENIAIGSDQIEKPTAEAIKKRAIKYFPIKDTQQNMLMSLMPIPTDWKLSDKKDENIFLESPKGVKTYYVVGNVFMYSNDNFMNDYFRQMGQQTKQPQPFEQVLEELKGYANKDGAKLTKQYELPQLKRSDENLDRLLFKSSPEQKTIRVVATEWMDDKGMSSIIIIHYYVAYTEMSLYWGYYVEGMEAPKNYFPTARRDFVNALLNVQINPQWIQSQNQKVQQQMQQQMAGHKQRMAGLRAQGAQIVAAGKQHDAMTTRTHQKFMDGLNDRISVTNPSSGQSYKVDLGSNHYWINDNNQLITSDNANYNPNGDLNTNGTWTEAQIDN